MYCTSWKVNTGALLEQDVPGAPSSGLLGNCEGFGDVTLLEALLAVIPEQVLEALVLMLALKLDEALALMLPRPEEVLRLLMLILESPPMEELEARLLSEAILLSNAVLLEEALVLLLL